jgi:hypothetical protein
MKKIETPQVSIYKKQDLLAQKIFGTMYFTWLDSWEQFHLIQKYNLDKNLQTN